MERRASNSISLLTFKVSVIVFLIWVLSVLLGAALSYLLVSFLISKMPWILDDPKSKLTTVYVTMILNDSLLYLGYWNVKRIQRRETAQGRGDDDRLESTLYRRTLTWALYLVCLAYAIIVSSILHDIEKALPATCEKYLLTLNCSEMPKRLDSVKAFCIGAGFCASLVVAFRAYDALHHPPSTPAYWIRKLGGALVLIQAGLLATSAIWTPKVFASTLSNTNGATFLLFLAVLGVFLFITGVAVWAFAILGGVAAVYRLSPWGRRRRRSRDHRPDHQWQNHVDPARDHGNHGDSAGAGAEIPLENYPPLTWQAVSTVTVGIVA